MLNLYKNYNITKDKLNELESKDYNINYIVSENNRLKKILDEVNFSTDEQVSKVLIDKKSPFLHSIIIKIKNTNNIIQLYIPFINFPFFFFTWK